MQKQGNLTEGNDQYS